jgi:hypothetical protein
MTIVFSGAPVVNAIVALIQHPPAGGWGTIRAPFWIGIVLAVTGGALVTKFKPRTSRTGKEAYGSRSRGGDKSDALNRRAWWKQAAPSVPLLRQR